MHRPAITREPNTNMMQQAVPEARRDGWCDKGRVRDMRPAACTAGTQLYPRPVPAMPASQRLGEHRPIRRAQPHPLE